MKEWLIESKVQILPSPAEWGWQKTANSTWKPVDHSTTSIKSVSWVFQKCFKCFMIKYCCSLDRGQGLLQMQEDNFAMYQPVQMWRWMWFGLSNKSYVPTKRFLCINNVDYVANKSILCPMLCCTHHEKSLNFCIVY